MASELQVGVAEVLAMGNRFGLAFISQSHGRQVYTYALIPWSHYHVLDTWRMSEILAHRQYM